MFSVAGFPPHHGCRPQVKLLLSEFAAKDPSYKAFMGLCENRNVSKHLQTLLNVTDDPLTIEAVIVTNRSVSGSLTALSVPTQPSLMCRLNCLFSFVVAGWKAWLLHQLPSVSTVVGSLVGWLALSGCVARGAQALTTCCLRHDQLSDSRLGGACCQVSEAPTTFC